MNNKQDQRVRLKICGITNLEDARFASGALVDYLGFIFYDKSPRYIEPGEAGAIINWLEGPGKVGVFVNQPLDDVNRIAKETGLDYVQLHGNESPEYCELVEKPVIKVLHIGPDTLPSLLKKEIDKYRDIAEYLLFDTKLDGQWGGTGETFDWSVLEDIKDEIPFFLSGGLDAGNIREAVSSVNPYGVDLSSGLEQKPGLKDFGKIEDLMDEMRDIWEEQAAH